MKKKTVIVLSAILALSLVFVYIISAFRISFAEYKFIADFNSGLSAFEYAPLNPKLEHKFTFESVEFKASYSYNKIEYKVIKPTDDLTAECKAFDKIYNLYYDSFTEYNKQTAVGNVGVDKSLDFQNVCIWISGYKYQVAFYLTDTPTIIYEKTAIA